MAVNLSYLGVALDRAADRRRDDAWVAARLADDATRVVAVWRGRNLIDGDDAAAGAGVPTPVLLSGSDAAPVLDDAGHVALLGLDGETAYFAADVSGLSEVTANELSPRGRFEDLRRVGTLLAAADAALLAFARGMMHWHRRHLYCGICGAPTASGQGGHVRRCIDETDPHTHFPRTDPAVIMLIDHPDPDGRGPACLLGHQERWPAGMYSTLAGFVEPGESLEEAVIREVFEETAIRCTDARYMASQPWPFPQSLMLGFRATARTTEIAADGNELADAGWFTPGDLAQFGEWVTAPEGARRLPRKDSISRWLIEGWRADVGG